MAPLYWLPFSLLLCLTCAHDIIVEWVPRPGGVGHNLVLYGVSIGGHVGEPLTITPGSEKASPHFHLTYDGTHYKMKDKGKDREFSFIDSNGQNEAIQNNKIKFKKHLKPDGKTSKSSSKTYTLVEFANMIAAGKVQYKATGSDKYKKLGKAYVNWHLADINLESIFDPARPKLLEAFEKVATEVEKGEDTLNFYLTLMNMQKIVGEDTQKDEMTRLYDGFLKNSHVSLGTAIKKELEEAYKRDWTDADGNFIGTGLDENGHEDANNAWHTAKVMTTEWIRARIWGAVFRKSEEFRDWVRKSGEYSLRYNEDFQSIPHTLEFPPEPARAKESINNAMEDDEYANDFDAELGLAFARGYKAGLGAKKEKNYGAGLLRKKYRY